MSPSTSRRVLVTGAASGLGAALTAAFNARGDEVLATDLEPPAGPGWLRLDVTSDDDWAAARDRDAGVAGGGRVDLCTLEEWRWLTEVNLFGVVRGTRAFAPMLKAQGSGLVVNVASLAGLVHPPGMGAYNATKAAVVAFSETVGHELAPYGVRCAVVCPSYFRTNLVHSIRGADTDVAAKVRAMVERSPITADEVAAAVLAGIDAGDDVIVPDAPARLAVELKRSDRAAYDAEMRRTADRMREREQSKAQEAGA